MRRFLFILILVLIMTGCGNTSNSSEMIPAMEDETAASMDSQTVIISVGASATLELPEYLDCSDGTRIELRVYPNSVLGSDLELIRGCQKGSISAFLGEVMAQNEVIPETSLLNIPYLYEDLKEWQEAYYAKFPDWFQPYYHAQGLHLVASDVSYLRCIASNIPIYDMDDFRNLKLRVMENFYQETYWSSFGVVTYPLPFSEISYSLKQGKINSVEAGIRALYLSGEMEKMDYFIETHHVPYVTAFVMNLEEYESLTPAQQEAISHIFETEFFESIPEEEYVENAGLTTITLDAEVKKTLKKQQDVVIELLKERLGEKLVEEFLQMASS